MCNNRVKNKLQMQYNYVKSQFINGQMNIYAKQFYTLLFLFWKFVRYSFIHFESIYIHIIKQFLHIYTKRQLII